MRPAWSPDGSRIVFASVNGDRVAIFIMNADGSNRICISDDGCDDNFPDWFAIGMLYSPAITETFKPMSTD
jgi:Tol biopolymer transport system component